MKQILIQCQNLSHFYSEKAALDNVSFELPTGQPTGLVGPNGAGKTTLLSILCGFILPTAGSVTIFGQKPGDASLCGRLSALPQDAMLDPSFSIGDQLTFYAQLQGLNSHQAKQETIRVLDVVELKQVFHENPKTLSHGMAKRVAIAQALIGTPELILLDEPTAGLDPVNTRNIRTIIADLSTQSTFIISSHDLTELGRLCQKVLLLDQGKLTPMNLNDSEQNKPTRFFTLQMTDSPTNDLINALKQIKGVVQISNPQKNEFIIEYNPAIEPQMDIKTLNCLAENKWEYRQISQGKTLEEKLFFESHNKS